jgi:hypothetical protein
LVFNFTAMSPPVSWPPSLRAVARILAYPYLNVTFAPVV